MCRDNGVLASNRQQSFGSRPVHEASKPTPSSSQSAPNNNGGKGQQRVNANDVRAGGNRQAPATAAANRMAPTPAGSGAGAFFFTIWNYFSRKAIFGGRSRSSVDAIASH